MIDWMRNIYRGFFLHRKCKKEDSHIRYVGMSVNGFKCDDCGYEYYEKINRN